MKIAHILYSFGLGGIETMLTNIANEQVRLGHDVHIYVINDILAESLRGQLHPSIHFHPLKRRPGSRNPWPLLRLNAALLWLHPDVIHLHYASISRYLLRPLMRKRLCVTLHAMCSPQNSPDLWRCTPIYAISNMVREDIRTKYNLESTTIYNGIRTDAFARRDSQKPTPAHFRIVQVSRLFIDTKGQDLVIEAASLLRKRGIDNFTVTFIGDGDDRALLETMVRERNLENCVKFLGSRSQEYITGHLKDYDLFVQPSRFDGFAITVAEAMVAQVPVVVCDDMAPYEVIDHGRYGRSFKGGDASSLADALEKAMLHYPTPAEIEDARRHAEENFSIENTVKRYMEYYPRQ